MTTTSDFGVGAQVYVRDASAADTSEWPTEPSGIIVRAGDTAVSSVWGRAAVGGRHWWVEFDEPALNHRGDGPFATAQINERYLELAPPVSFED